MDLGLGCYGSMYPDQAQVTNLWPKKPKETPQEVKTDQSSFIHQNSKAEHFWG